MANEYSTRPVFWRQFEITFFFKNKLSECTPNDKNINQLVQHESEVIPTVSDSMKNFKEENEKVSHCWTVQSERNRKLRRMWPVDGRAVCRAQ
jgi:hypothetical protein